jgi:predicted Zn finger-like uncharacterized protein
MRLTCEHCEYAFDLPDSKVPNASRFRFRCPKCGERNFWDRDQAEREPGETGAGAQDEDGVEDMEPEMYPPGEKVAFVFIQDETWREKAEQYCFQAGYHVSTAEKPAEAMQKLRLNSYNMVILEDRQENARVLQEIGKWPGWLRREVNCIMVGDQAESFDPNMAFVQGVNSYLTLNEADQAEELLERAQRSLSRYLELWRLARQYQESEQQS